MHRMVSCNTWHPAAHSSTSSSSQQPAVRSSRSWRWPQQLAAHCFCLYALQETGASKHSRNRPYLSICPAGDWSQQASKQARSQPYLPPTFLQCVFDTDCCTVPSALSYCMPLAGYTSASTGADYTLESGSGSGSGSRQPSSLPCDREVNMTRFRRQGFGKGSAGRVRGGC
jgi:hypothetical protein